MYKDKRRKFTPDGHLVGSIGEVVAADTYGLILENSSNKGFDAKTRDDETVEIKLTGGKSAAVSSEYAETPKILIVLKLKDTGFTEIYNGTFPLDLWLSKKPSKRRVRTLGIAELAARNEKLLKEQHPLEALNRMFGPGELAVETGERPTRRKGR